MIDLDELITAQLFVGEPRRSVVERHRAELAAAISAAERGDPVPIGPSRSRRPVQPLLAVAAAVAVVTFSVLAIVPFASTGRSADAIAVDAATATADRLAHSGRAQVSTSDSRGTEVATFAFAGDDWSMALDGQEVARVVDDTHYVYTDDYGDDAAYQWWADGATVSNDIPDFSGLLAVLSPTANFEILDEAIVGDRPITHLRAATPSAIPSEAFGIWRLIDGSDGWSVDVTELDVWIDDEDIVRRIDVSWTSSMDGSSSSYLTSIELSDLGAAVHVGAPSQFQVLSTDISD